MAPRKTIPLIAVSALAVAAALASCVPLATPFTTLDPPACDDPSELIPLAHALAYDLDRDLLVDNPGEIEEPHEVGYIVSKTHWNVARVCAARYVGLSGEVVDIRWSRQDICYGFPDRHGGTSDRCVVPDGETTCDATSRLRFDQGARRSVPLD